IEFKKGFHTIEIEMSEDENEEKIIRMTKKDDEEVDDEELSHIISDHDRR
ncbi:MAG: hypothetical protein GXO64_04810, partial [Candidatus Micrarchaeota archaeon]|nr:hypothetical protein [Candidatus Micrarchaeota archaeon]